MDVVFLILHALVLVLISDLVVVLDFVFVRVAFVLILMSKDALKDGGVTRLTVLHVFKSVTMTAYLLRVADVYKSIEKVNEKVV